MEHTLWQMLYHYQSKALEYLEEYQKDISRLGPNEGYTDYPVSYRKYLEAKDKVKSLLHTLHIFKEYEKDNNIINYSL